MIRFFSFILLILLTLKINSQVIKIDVDPQSQPKGALMLSDLAKEVEYIPLETNDNCMVGKITSYDVSENYIVVANQQTNKVFLFHRNGRFVSQIGSQGQDGSVFSSIDNVLLDELKNCLYVFDDHKKLLKYDLSGKLLNSYLFGNIDLIISYWKNQFLTGIYKPPKENDFVYKILDSSMELVKQGVKAVPVEMKGRYFLVLPPISCYIYQEYPYVKESVLNDTIYYINENNEFIPKYIINFGRYGMTAEMKGDVDHFFEYLINGKCIGGMTFSETPNFLLSKYEYMNKRIPCYFDKRSNKLFYFESADGIPDDYAGGVEFWPDKQKNNELYCFKNASELIEKFSKQEKFTPKGSSSSVQKIQSLLTTLNKDDNAVLIIVKIK